MLRIIIALLLLIINVNSYYYKKIINRNYLMGKKYNYDKDFENHYDTNYEMNKYKNFNILKDLDIERSMFVIISEKNKSTDDLLSEASYYGLNIHFSDKQNYTGEELDKIKNKYIVEDCINQPWIFMNDKFIGGIFEFYSLFFKFL